jgi:fumarylacetoacetase
LPLPGVTTDGDSKRRHRSIKKGFSGERRTMSTPSLNETHDPARRSWVASANEPGGDFPIQNLPFGIFRRSGSAEPGRGGVAVGDEILDIAACAPLFEGAARAAAEVCGADTLRPLVALGADAWSALRLALSRLLNHANREGRSSAEHLLTTQTAAELLLPFKITGFTDFFASINHATNAGRMFRPDQPLLPNYKFVPIAYQGRASTFRASGAAIQRPRGQIKLPDNPIPLRQPSNHLDYELELGMLIGKESSLGEPVSIDRAGQHIFGFCLLNDWSARDIQSWEYQPLGPFLAKSFATTISPWIVTEEALRPYRTNAFVRPPGDPKPLPYLHDATDQATGALDITMEVYLRSKEMIRRQIAPLRLSQSSAASLYWTVAQMVTHQTSNGCNLEIGDVIGSGTISGESEGSFGSLLEITRRGQTPLQLPTSEQRVFLEDGDEVIFKGFCERAGFARIGFGTCMGTISPALKDALS